LPRPNRGSARRALTASKKIGVAVTEEGVTWPAPGRSIGGRVGRGDRPHAEGRARVAADRHLDTSGNPIFAALVLSAVARSGLAVI